MSNKHLKWQVLFAGLLLWLVMPPAIWSEPVAKWPTETWETAAPESAGFNSVKLAEALREMRARNLNIHSLTVIRHGRVLVDATFYPYYGRVPHNLASVTKSVMTTLIAIAAGQGKLNLDQPVVDFFPNRAIAHRDGRKERMTVRQLTGMSSGLACVGEHDEPTLHQMNASRDWIQFTLDLEMAAEPGNVFSYCSPGMHLLSAILQQATGQTALDFARENLFTPLGIREVIWPADPQGVTSGWGDLHLYPTDAAKLGELWLRGGQWKGRQIVPKDWVQQSASLQIGTGPLGGDGYGWWIRSGSPPGYDARGRGGQFISVFPTLDAVVVTTGAGFDPGDALELLGRALINPEGPLTADPAGTQALAAALAFIKEPLVAQPVPPSPAMAAAISEKTYRLAPNPLQLATIGLSFDSSAEALMSITFADGQPPRSGAVGLDGVYRFSPGEAGLPAGMRGRWLDDNRFALEL